MDSQTKTKTMYLNILFNSDSNVRVAFAFL